MDGHEHRELNDETLERDLESALRVDPSPEFRAKVRARVAKEPRRDGWHFSTAWRWAFAASAMTMVAVLGLWLLRSPAPATPDRVAIAPPVESSPSGPKRGRAEDQVRQTADQATLSRVAPAPVVAARDVRPRRAPVPAYPEVLISQDEAAALRQLFATISNRRLDTAVLPDLDASLERPMPIEEIVLEPITVTPLASVESE